MSESTRVPTALQAKHDEIVALVDEFCQQHLNEEYRDVCRLMVVKLCRMLPAVKIRQKLATQELA